MISFDLNDRSRDIAALTNLLIVSLSTVSPYHLGAKRVDAFDTPLGPWSKPSCRCTSDKFQKPQNQIYWV